VCGECSLLQEAIRLDRGGDYRQAVRTYKQAIERLRTAIMSTSLSVSRLRREAIAKMSLLISHFFFFIADLAELGAAAYPIDDPQRVRLQHLHDVAYQRGEEIYFNAIKNQPAVRSVPLLLLTALS
jgi:hypothetical protein